MQLVHQQMSSTFIVTRVPLIKILSMSKYGFRVLFSFHKHILHLY